MSLVDVLQFHLVPLGAFLLPLAYVGALLLLRQGGPVRIGLYSAVGVAVGIALAAALWLGYRLPWLNACIDCLANSPLYSVSLAILQGWGYTMSALVICRWFQCRRSKAVASAA